MINNQLFRFRQDNNLKYLVIDTETESLNLRYSRPWQASWLVIENGKLKEEHNHFLYFNNLEISDGARKQTGFDEKEYKKLAEDPVKVGQILDNYLNSDYYIVGQNYLFFDIYQIANWFRQCGLRVNFEYIKRIYDILPMGRAYQKNVKFPDKKEEIIYWQYQWSNYRERGLKARLEDLCKCFNLEHNKDLAHDGLYDCKKTDEVFRKLYWSMDIH
jgi:DNA polymerase III epsilon subunit-like protein